MIEAQKEKYRSIIRQGVESLPEDDLEAREVIYRKLRLANESLLERKGAALKPEMAAALRAALEEVISEDKDRARQKAGATERAAKDDIGFDTFHRELQHSYQPAIRSSASAGEPASGKLVAGMITGAVIVVLAGAAAAALGLITVSAGGPSSGPTAALEQVYKANLPQVETAAKFLERVRDRTVERQKANGAAVSALAEKKYIPLKDFDAELAKQVPKSLPKGSAVILRANATDYKILFNWPLCGTVQVARPELVDPKRKLNVVGCPYFGLWSKGGAAW